MADTVQMEVDSRYSTENQYKYSETLDSPGPGKAILIPGGDISSVSYQLEPDAGGSIQVTNYDEDAIIADSAVWITITSGDQINPSISAIRQNNTSGTTVFTVRAQ